MKVIIKHNQVNHVIPLDAVIAVEKSETTLTKNYPASMWRFTIVMIGGYRVEIDRIGSEHEMISISNEEYKSWTEEQRKEHRAKMDDLYFKSLAELKDIYDQFMKVWEPEQRFVTIGG